MCDVSCEPVLFRWLCVFEMLVLCMCVVIVTYACCCYGCWVFVLRVVVWLGLDVVLFFWLYVVVFGCVCVVRLLCVVLHFVLVCCWVVAGLCY